MNQELIVFAYPVYISNKSVFLMKSMNIKANGGRTPKRQARVINNRPRRPQASSSMDIEDSYSYMNNPRRTQPLASSAGSARPLNATSHRLKDHDLILSVNAAVTYARIPCNPRLWPNTRAFQESLGWQTYTPHSITVTWQPGVAATTAGQITGGTLYFNQTVTDALRTNALMSTAGSYSGPIWQPCRFRMDLSALTQPKYFLASTEEDGVPADLYVEIPATAVGLLNIEYDISFSGHCTAPAQVPVYDIVARTITAPANMTSEAFSNANPLAWKGNNLKAEWRGGGNVQLTKTSGGGGTVVQDATIFGPMCDVLVIDQNTIGFYEGGSPLYLNTAAMENTSVGVWLSGYLL